MSIHLNNINKKDYVMLLSIGLNSHSRQDQNPSFQLINELPFFVSMAFLTKEQFRMNSAPRNPKNVGLLD